MLQVYLLQSRDSHATVLQGGCVKGSLYLNDEAWQAIQTGHNGTGNHNTFLAADAPAYWPLQLRHFCKG